MIPVRSVLKMLSVGKNLDLCIINLNLVTFAVVVRYIMANSISSIEFLVLGYTYLFNAFLKAILVSLTIPPNTLYV